MPQLEDTVAADSKLAFVLIFIGLPFASLAVDLYLISFSLELLIISILWFGLGLLLVPLFFNADE
ncbi:MAG: hypothetical protein HY556_08790 [Euryarchaeota archaeon]|nr:hypothetical protein [Euryarchaeota archaeon]